MPVEKEIRKATKKFELKKNIPEFIDRAKFLEERLKKGEKLSIEVSEDELVGPASYTVHLELHKKGEKPERVANLGCLGRMSYRFDLFKDYNPSLESQRE